MPATDVPIVLYLVDGLGLSGKTKSMVDLACALDPARYQAVVVCFNEEDSPLLDTLRKKNVPVFEVRCPDGLNVGVMLRLATVMRQVGPTVVHCYNPRAMLYGGLVARAFGIRSTVGSLSAFACAMPDQGHAVLPQRLLTRSRRNRLRNRLAVRLMNNIVSVTRSLGETFCLANGIATDRLRVVPYGVELDDFRDVTVEAIARFRAGIGVPNDAVLVGSVGRLVEQKDYPTQLRALAHALKAAPRLWMVLAGDGPLRGALEGFVSQLGVGARVTFLGHTAQVPLLLRSIDVFVMASTFEPYGVALLEAKAAGAAIVATTVNAIPELIANGNTGLLVPSSRPDALGDVFVRLANDPDLRRTLGAAAAADAAARHRLSDSTDGYAKIYDAVRRVPSSAPTRVTNVSA